MQCNRRDLIRLALHNLIAVDVCNYLISFGFMIWLDSKLKLSIAAGLNNDLLPKNGVVFHTGA